MITINKLGVSDYQSPLLTELVTKMFQSLAEVTIIQSKF